MKSSIRYVLVVAAAMVGASAVSGCGGQSGTSGQVSAEQVMSEQSGKGLEAAITAAIAAGKGYSLRDVTGLGRNVNKSAPSRWKVCLQRKGGPPQSVDFGVVLNSERCLKTWTGHNAVPRMPDLAGKDVRTAEEAILDMGYPAADIKLSTGTAAPTGSAESGDIAGWVCTQEPRAGEPFHNPATVKLQVDEGSCP